MAKRIQPKMSRTRKDVLHKAAHLASWNAAESLLRCLFLASRQPTSRVLLKSGEDYRKDAICHARDLLDFGILGNLSMPPGEVLLRIATRDRTEFAPFLDVALALLCSLQSTANRSAAA